MATGRHDANEASRNTAEHHNEPWAGYELEILMLWGGGDAELAEIAELLGRTIEACRQRFYETRKDGATVRTVKTTRTETRVITETRWSAEDDEEWPEGWYVR